MNKFSQQAYIPALKYHALTGFYDAAVALAH